MDGRTPAWWMRGCTRPQQMHSEPDASLQPPPPDSSGQAKDTDSPDVAQSMLRALSGRLAHADSETLLLLGLIWLLREDHADTKLLLALTYILL
ncbi:MAG: hypothetical protein IKS42_09915 [Oscillospiraceae bacterium]|nr:hypothetical protein [Oscillospiraceae bacterium]